jgi:DNA-binding response OmpR family regulator
MMRKKILVVEDDASLGFVIKDNLERAGYQISLSTDGEAGEKSFFSTVFDLVILDVMLPKKDGFAVAKSIRAANKEIPILFLTAKSMAEDKIEGFKIGGDDFIIKPFNMEELIYRIEVFLRRKSNHIQDTTISFGETSIDFKNLELKCGGYTTTLTQKEGDLLRLLIENQDKVLKREEILTSIWGDDDYFAGRSMDVFISKLRKYLKDDPNTNIVNYHGVGFKLETNAKAS